MTKKTGEPGAEPGVDFNADAEKILQEMNGETPADTPKEEEPGKPEEKKTPSEEEKKAEEEAWKLKAKEESVINKKEEELKIPRSRLNKEIEKKNSIQSKYDKLAEKVKKEEDRLEALSDDDKEEQSNLKKLGMDTKLSKLQDKLEDMWDDMSDKDTEIASLQDTIKKSETANLSSRITELTEKMDWKDGLPKFDITELLEFSKQKNFLPNDPLELYNFKYQAEIYAKKYVKPWTEIDKGNKWTFKPVDKKPTFASGDKDFMDEATRIMDSIGWSK